jgi:hypothetical protein
MTDEADEIAATVIWIGQTPVAVVFSKGQALTMAQKMSGAPPLFCASTFQRPHCAAASGNANGFSMMINHARCSGLPRPLRAHQLRLAG